MAKIIQCPQLNTRIGTYQGNPILARFLSSGYNISIPINKDYLFDPSYKPTYGIQVSEMIIFKDNNKTIWKESVHVPHNIIRNLMLQYFEDTAWLDMHNFFPSLSKEDAFGIYVVKTIPKVIPNWSTSAWRNITLNMINDGIFNHHL